MNPPDKKLTFATLFFYFVLILFKTFDRRFKREAFYIIYLANIFGNI